MTLSEAVTLSFYAWEVRGRGWTLADYPVALEPPFRPCFLLPEHQGVQTTPIDDGKRHTLISRLVASFSGKGESVRERGPAFEEQAPFETVDPGPLVTLGVTVPYDFAEKPAVMVELLAALSTADYPVAFEVVSVAGTVTIQLTVAEDDANRVIAYIESYAPSVHVGRTVDALDAAHQVRNTVQVVELGLADEFFVPLRTKHPIDPYLSLLPALADTKEGEFLVLQVLFTRVMNPWSGAIREALDDGEGGCIMDDAPWLLKAAHDKTSAPLVSAVIRIGAEARDDARARALLQSVGAFVAQVGSPDGNELVALEDAGVDPWMLLSERLSFRTGMVLGADELRVVAHFPDASVRSPCLVRSRENTSPVPRLAVGHPFVLGENVYKGVTTPVSIDLESRFAHTWMIGGSGTGKSTLLANMVLRDLDAGHGVAVFDVHGDLVDDILARVPEHRRDDVILFDPADAAYPVGFNILRATSELEATVLSADLVSIFRRLSTSWGDSMSTVLGEAVLAMLHHPDGGTLVHLRRFLVEDAFRTSWLSAIPDPDIRYFWDHEYKVIGSRSVGPLLTRLDGFLRMRLMRNIVGVRKPALDIGTVMDTGKVFLARLAKGEIGEENAVLLGSLLLAKITERALMRQSLPREARRPFFAYVDEAQHFAVPSVESLATEGRKYRVGLVLAHQTRAQLANVPSLEGALLANCHTRVVFRVGDEDARTLAKGFLHFAEDDLTAQGRGEAIVRVGTRDADCNLRTAPLPRVGDDAVRELIRDRTRRVYASRPEPVDRTFAAPPPLVEVAPVVVESGPASPTAVHDQKHVPPPRTTTTRKEIPPPPSTPATPGRGGQHHKYLQALVKRLAEERGFRATIEGAAGPGQVDVLLVRDELRVGVEISVTTDHLHEVENLRKCVAAGFNRIIFVSSEKRVRTKVSEVVACELSGTQVSVIGPEDIVTALDAFGQQEQVSETLVRGIKVRVTRKALSPTEASSQQRAVAAVIAKSMKR